MQEMIGANSIPKDNNDIADPKYFLTLVGKKKNKGTMKNINGLILPVGKAFIKFQSLGPTSK